MIDAYWLIGHGGVTTDLQYLDELISNYFGYHLPAHGHDRGGRCGRGLMSYIRVRSVSDPGDHR